MLIKFENPINGRYYYLTVANDLFNKYVLTITRGGVSARVVKHLGFDCMEKIKNEIDRLTKRRLKRGYILTT